MNEALFWAIALPSLAIFGVLAFRYLEGPKASHIPPNASRVGDATFAFQGYWPRTSTEAIARELLVEVLKDNAVGRHTAQQTLLRIESFLRDTK